MKLLNKRAEATSGLQAFIVGIAGVAIVLVVTLVVVGNLQTVADNPSSYCTATYTYNSSQNYCQLTANTSQPSVAIARTAEYTAAGSMSAKLGTIPTWVGIIIVVALAFVVLGFFYGKQEGFF